MTHVASPVTFSQKDPAEIITVTFDFSDLVAAVTSATVTASWKRGTADASPSSLLSGGTSTSGAKVLQKIQGGNAGADYVLRCQVDTADGQRFVMAALLPVRTA